VYTGFYEIKFTFVRTFSLTVIRCNGYIVQKVTEINLRVVWPWIFIMRKCEMPT